MCFFKYLVSIINDIQVITIDILQHLKYIGIKHLNYEGAIDFSYTFVILCFIVILMSFEVLSME